MSLFGGVIPITGITFLMFCLFAVAVVGYSLGRVTIKGVNLGTAGVFIIALLFGCFFFEPLAAQLTVKNAAKTESIAYVEQALKIVE
ncbi:MAG: permease, partial [Lachnospiraceae bacterium]|nr:permease [Lachnospiraceae bacterium]